MFSATVQGPPSILYSVLSSLRLAIAFCPKHIGSITFIVAPVVSGRGIISKFTTKLAILEQFVAVLVIEVIVIVVVPILVNIEDGTEKLPVPAEIVTLALSFTEIFAPDTS